MQTLEDVAGEKGLSKQLKKYKKWEVMTLILHLCNKIKDLQKQLGTNAKAEF